MNSNNTYYKQNQKNTEKHESATLKKVIKKPKEYLKNKKNIQTEARNKYRKLSNEEKDIKRKYLRDWNRNMLVEDTQKLKECKKYFCWFTCSIKDESNKGFSLVYGSEEKASDKE